MILLCDSEKIGKDRFAVVEGLESVDVLITDAKLRPEQKSALEEAGLDVRMAPENQ